MSTAQIVRGFRLSERRRDRPPSTAVSAGELEKASIRNVIHSTSVMLDPATIEQISRVYKKTGLPQPKSIEVTSYTKPEPSDLSSRPQVSATVTFADGRTQDFDWDLPQLGGLDI